MNSRPVSRQPSVVSRRRWRPIARFLPFIAVLLFLLAPPASRLPSPAFALDLGKVENFMNALEKKIEEASRAGTGSKRTMTGGVRAAQQKEEVRLYWRGKPKKAAAAAPRASEDAARAQAIIALLKEKKTEQARAEIEAFAKAFPDSPFKSELEAISSELTAGR